MMSRSHITNSPEFTSPSYVTIEVLRTVFEPIKTTARPKCIGCGWTDGCVDDAFGAVDTLWTDSPYGMLCRSCVNTALWNAYGKRRAVELHPVCPDCKGANTDAHYDFDHVCPVYENAYADWAAEGMAAHAEMR